MVRGLIDAPGHLWLGSRMCVPSTSKLGSTELWTIQLLRLKNLESGKLSIILYCWFGHPNQSLLPLSNSSCIRFSILNFSSPVSSNRVVCVIICEYIVRDENFKYGCRKGCYSGCTRVWGGRLLLEVVGWDGYCGSGEEVSGVEA